jgi:hypothetical protein
VCKTQCEIATTIGRQEDCQKVYWIGVKPLPPKLWKISKPKPIICSRLYARPHLRYNEMLRQFSSQDCKGRIQPMMSIDVANAKPSQHRSCVGDAKGSVWECQAGVEEGVETG